ncbi:hypothetical protein [Trujillonella endophytica]|uniref:Uncharacterized protein n=1 Tax=Trujillonella endophytica TaxID=673521 RepID=A0A1H8TH04_9ACTN|nr:hypothetical protein [Trujillella endophytica]SEO90380.1 hypothetical protein SAMN05660991_02268 [Trujillella endophytica]
MSTSGHEPFPAGDPHTQGYTAQPGYPAQPYTPQPYAPQPYAQPGYADQQSYTDQQGYAAQPGYADQQGYTAQPGYADQQGYTDQPGYAAQHGSYGGPAYYYGQQPQPYGPYGVAAGRPGGVVTAAVLGFVWGGLGALVTLFLLYYGLAASSFSDAPGVFGDVFGAAAGILLFTGLLALAWTVVMIWGSVWVLSGRSRVPLLVGGSIAIACTGLVFVGGIGAASDGEGPGGTVFGLICLVVSILIVVLLANRQSAGFFAAARAHRPR